MIRIAIAVREDADDVATSDHHCYSKTLLFRPLPGLADSWFGGKIPIFTPCEGCYRIPMEIAGRVDVILPFTPLIG
jgi:hypothetical protein